MSRFPVLRAVERADQLVSRHLGRLVEGAGLTEIEAQVLFHLDHLPKGSKPAMRDLQSAFGLPPTTLTAVLDRLERRRLVKRAVNPDDRRSTLVVPTALGRRRIAEMSALLTRIEAAVSADVSAEDVAAFQRVLAALERATQ
ncbi:MAG TPA: MarR family transcriptional regulator [Candidatus Dormibacteraeota bacterium]|nr:MarR family transcriptional regulator [Candidatus Dormibacteraeota bacterium]